MKIAIASDHAGYPLKKNLTEVLKKGKHELLDLSGDNPDPQDDYPDFAKAVALAVAQKKS